MLYYSGIFPIYFLFCFSFSYFKYCSEGYLLHFLVALTFHTIHIIMEDIANINIEHINYVQSLSLHENINKSDFYQIILIGVEVFSMKNLLGMQQVTCAKRLFLSSGDCRSCTFLIERLNTTQFRTHWHPRLHVSRSIS